MNTADKQALKYLLQNNYYLKVRGRRTTQKNKGKLYYTIYRENAVPIVFVEENVFDAIRYFLKCNSKKQYTLNYTIVRQQHGNTWIKKQYNQIKKQIKCQL